MAAPDVDAFLDRLKAIGAGLKLEKNPLAVTDGKVNQHHDCWQSVKGTKYKNRLCKPFYSPFAPGGNMVSILVVLGIPSCLVSLS